MRDRFQYKVRYEEASSLRSKTNVIKAFEPFKEYAKEEKFILENVSN